MITPDKIEEVKNCIVNFMHPEKIILFGSYADGNPTEDSDLDLLIVHKTDLPRKERRLPVRKALREFKFPMDIIIYTPDEITALKDSSMAFITQVVESGKVIYVR